MFSYKKLIRKPKVFRKFTGLTVEQGKTLYKKIEQQYPKQERKRLERKNRKRAIGARTEVQAICARSDVDGVDVLSIVHHERTFRVFVRSGSKYDQSRCQVHGASDKKLYSDTG